MKFSPLLRLLPAASIATAGKVSYDGAKAIRIPVGEDVTQVMSVIHELDLPVWKGLAQGVPAPNSHVDIVVPASKVAEFEDLTSSITTEVMHEDLGLSIAEEGIVTPYGVYCYMIRGVILTLHSWNSGPYVVQRIPCLCRSFNFSKRSSSYVPSKFRDSCGWKICCWTSDHWHSLLWIRWKGVQARYCTSRNSGSWKVVICFNSQLTQTQVHAREWITTLVRIPAISLHWIDRP